MARIDRVAVITRLRYGLDDPRFDTRLRTYKEYTLPSLLAQTDQDFDIYVLCQPHHNEIITSLSPRINVFSANDRQGNTGTFFTDWNLVRGIEQYTGQLNVDSDDELMPSAIAEVKKYLNGARKAISLQPIICDRSTGRKYHMVNYQSRKKLASIFCIYQPDEPYHFIYESGHNTGMSKLFKKKVYLYDLAVMNCGDWNDTTSIDKDALGEI